VRRIGVLMTTAADDEVALGRNVTGFTSFEFRNGGKWLELLKQIALMPQSRA
jgi:hypothetical protein